MGDGRSRHIFHGDFLVSMPDEGLRGRQASGHSAPRPGARTRYVEPSGAFCVSLMMDGSGPIES